LQTTVFVLGLLRHLQNLAPLYTCVLSNYRPYRCQIQYTKELTGVNKSHRGDITFSVEEHGAQSSGGFTLKEGGTQQPKG